MQVRVERATVIEDGASLQDAFPNSRRVFSADVL
jgi:hypothetical protein